MRGIKIGNLSLVASLLALAACQSAPTVADAPPLMAPAPVAAKPAFGSFGFDTAGMNRAVKPGDDFFAYANGAWNEATEMPADRSRLSVFTILGEKAAQRTAELIQGAATMSNDEARKIADMYASYLDEATIEAKGLAPVKAELDMITAIKDRRALSAAMGAAMRSDVDALNWGDVTTDRPFGLWVAEDFADPSQYAPYLLQGGLWLPDRDYYLEQSFAETRAKYQTHMASLFRLAGFDDADARAKRVMELETAIARTHATQVESRDVIKANNPWSRSDFAAKAPGIDWGTYFEAAGLKDQQRYIVWQPKAVTGFAKLAGAQSLQAWKDYLAFHAIARAAPLLPKAIADESFAFNGTVLSGQKQQRDRWKRAVDATNEALGHAVGKLYVAKYFPPEAKAAADTMVRNIVAAFGQRLDRLDWMSAETRARAKEKLATLQTSIGHPATWRDYSALEIRRDDAYGNWDRAVSFEYRRNLAKLGQPVDRSEWFMLPQEVNALNSPQQNSIIFPAAILEPPFFDAKADPAVNYGAIGAVIGHEITHSFDDIGALFDAKGKLANWWTPADFAKFKEASAQLVAQFNGYRALPDLNVNGELTLGENIADLGGLAMAFDGYRLSLQGKEAPVIDGFTGDQRVFLGWAQNWRSKYREAALRRTLLTDGHTPGPFRTYIVRNIDDWYPAFGVQPGERFYLKPEQRVRIW